MGVRGSQQLPADKEGTSALLQTPTTTARARDNGAKASVYSWLARMRSCATTHSQPNTARCCGGRHLGFGHKHPRRPIIPGGIHWTSPTKRYPTRA